jgi:group I intron endonuclease
MSEPSPPVILQEPIQLIILQEPIPSNILHDPIPPDNKAYIYKITNTINGKLYIGETKETNPQTRWKGHKYSIRKGHGCPLLRSAFQKYGEENFTFEVIQECTKDERFIVEEQKIKEFNTFVPNGYNATRGGMGGGFGGKKHSDATKQKMAKATTDKYASLTAERKEELRQTFINRPRRPLTEEHKQKIRNYRLGLGKGIGLGKKLSEENRKKISESVKRTYENGRDASFTEERKANLSKVMTEVRGVKIAQYTKEGEFIKTFPSIKSAGDELGITSIHRAVIGKNKTAGGFIWKRIEEH